MKIKIKNQEQRRVVEALLIDANISGVIVNDGEGIHFDDYVSFDDMANIIETLKSCTTMKELFEECWIAYKRKGSKKLAFEQWKKLTDEEKQLILPHIRAYEQSRDLPYRKDFERYLKDKRFLDVVFSKKGAILYDPSMFDVGVYSPRGHGIYYNETKKYYGFMDMYFDGDTIFDDYTDENRPDGATLVLNNARGTLVWDKANKKWNKVI